MGRAFLSVHRAVGQGAHLLHGGGPVRGKGGKEGGREGGRVGGWEVFVHRAGRQGAHLLYGGGQVRSEGGREGGRKEGSALLALCFNRSDCLTPNSSLLPSLPPSLPPSLDYATGTSSVSPTTTATGIGKTSAWPFVVVTVSGSITSCVPARRITWASAASS